MEEWSTAGGGGGEEQMRDGGGGGEEGVKGKGDLIGTLLGLRGWVWSRRRWWGGGRDERLQGKGTARVPGVQLRRVFPRLLVQKQNKKGRKR